MPFIAPAIVAAVGITGVAATIATAVVGAGVAYGLSYISSELFAPDATNTGAVDRGLQLNMQLNATAPRQIAFGKTATAGSLAYWQLSGTDNNIYDMVIALSDWPSNGLVGIFLDGKRLQLNIQGDGTYRVINVGGGSEGVDIDYGDKLKITFKNGDFDQTADAGLVSRSSGELSSSDRGAGVCYVIVTMEFDRELFPSVPQFKFEIEGAKLYDWRKDDTVGGTGLHRWDDLSTWEYTNNPGVIYYNWRRGLWYNGIRLYGMTTDASALETVSYTACANICDEQVSLQAGGTEDRYSCNGVVVTSADNGSVLKDILMSMGGEEVETGGLFKLYAGASRAIAMTLTSDDIVAGKGFSYTGKKSGDSLVNSVFGEYHNPEEGYVTASLPARTNTTDVLNDGMQHERSYRYGMVTSNTQGQRLMEMVRRKERLQASLESTFQAKASKLEPGDWVTFTDEQRGWINRVFKVSNMPSSDAREVKLGLEEINGDVFNWGISNEVSGASVVSVINTLPPLTTVTGLSVTPTLIQKDGVVGQFPGLQFSWTPILDLTVDALLFEYRIKDSSGIGLTIRAEDPNAGTLTTTNGIQGGLEYEVRCRPIVNPSRSVQWTAWTTAIAVTAPIIVEVGNTTINVGAGTVGTTELDDQSNYQLGLAADVANGLGSAWEVEYWHTQLALIEDHLGYEEHIRESELLVAETTTARAEIRTEQDVRASETTALSTTVQTVTTTVGTNTAAITQHTNSIDGIESRWGLDVTQNGEVIGQINLDGTNGTTFLTFLIDHFKIATVEGGVAIPIFAMDNTVSPPKMVLSGDFIADGTITGDHIVATTLSAISADLGTVNAGLIRSTDGNSYWNLDTGEFVMGAIVPLP